MEKCAICDGELIKDKKPQEFTRKDKSKLTIILEGLYCNSCGESFHSDEDLKEHTEKLKQNIV